MGKPVEKTRGSSIKVWLIQSQLQVTKDRPYGLRSARHPTARSSYGIRNLTVLLKGNGLLQILNSEVGGAWAKTVSGTKGVPARSVGRLEGNLAPKITRGEKEKGSE